VQSLPKPPQPRGRMPTSKKLSSHEYVAFITMSHPV